MTSLPAKLPLPNQPVAVTTLPMLGYLEQSAATFIIHSLSAVGIQKPKYPFLNSTKSALIFLGYHFKGYKVGTVQHYPISLYYNPAMLYVVAKCVSVFVPD